MLQDHEVPTPEQRVQLLYGRVMALTDVIAALIATHPDRQLLEKKISVFAALSTEVLVRIEALQHDDGLRQGYSDALASLRSLPGAD